MVVEADSDRLLQLESKLQQDNVEHAAIRERDPPFNGQLVAIGAKGEKEELQKYFSTIPLVR